MDLATFFKEYPALVTAVSSLLGIVLGYFLGKWNTKENRSFSRRAEIHDRRIQEAREYVEKQGIIINSSRQFAGILAEEDDPIKTLGSVLSFNDELLKVPSMLSETVRKRSSIDLLNDEKLSALHAEFISKFLPPYKELITLEEAFLVTEKQNKKGEGSGVRNTTKDMDVGGMIEAFRQAEEIIPKMKVRLDVLSKEVPR